MMQAAIKEGELVPETPVETLTKVIITELYGMMICWCMSDGTFEPKDWIDRFCDIQVEKMFEAYITKNDCSTEV